MFQVQQSALERRGASSFWVSSGYLSDRGPINTGPGHCGTALADSPDMSLGTQVRAVSTQRKDRTWSKSHHPGRTYNSEPEELVTQVRNICEWMVGGLGLKHESESRFTMQCKHTLRTIPAPTNFTEIGLGPKSGQLNKNC